MGWFWVIRLVLGNTDKNAVALPVRLKSEKAIARYSRKGSSCRDVPGTDFMERELMKIKRKLSCIGTGALLVLFALAMVGSTGCTVFTAGMTLPNPHYLNNRPQYFPRGTEFPFPNEAAVLQNADRAQQRSH